MTNMIPPEAPADCPLCPRLVAYREEVAEKHPDWFNGAVPSFGPETAELLIIGLAPGVTGANRTGRPFTGDWAGDLLYATIDKFGFSTGKFDARPDDGLKLKRAMITNAVRCVPPQNKPVGAEINQCRQFLTARIDALPNLKAMVCLGKISHDSTVRTLGLKLKDHPFGHGTHYDVEAGGRKVALLSSYHCSRYNTNTGRLTAEMFEDVFAMAKKITG
ncbi:uracil-DNA glycosylase [Hyphomonas beringensis]|uniref:Type-5 uracil-DNA glycosylase n=1 Tax=Hyphomonas beringensis TaxID=1280946 RepID=A0A062U3Y1_9PROT|nr:uracil-DNA glycosylase [Hyphomonas beringensis]KCZ55031.1 uracil-DNA glycosylase [Hyphomonas beringensis]